MSSTVGRWRAIRSVVAGRLVNCYATNDWILALLYRYSKVQLLQNYTCGVTAHVYLSVSVGGW